MTFEGIKNYRGEIWKTVNFTNCDSIHPEELFYISSYGRLIKLVKNTPTLVRPYLLNRYPHIKVRTTKTFTYRGYKKHRYKGYYLHKLVAEHFLEQGNGVYVIHLDYDKQNNEVRNLKWATKYEKEQHQWKNLTYINAKKQHKRPSAKLTENNVRLIKKLLNDPERRTRLKLIAKRFNISLMQLQRIKTGENWADIPPLE